MTKRLPFKVARSAAREIAEALACWKANRTKAPGAFREELRLGLDLIAVQPSIGARARNVKLRGVRRIPLSRIRYYLYYRVTPSPQAIEVLAFWHTSRGSSPNIRSP